MEKISTLTGTIVPLERSNVDTDQIIPAVFLKRVTKTGYDDALFHSWRQDPDFVLNQEPYKRGGVLVVGHDFGTGSSREHAVWALRDFGFTAVLGPRFGEIFRGNAGKQGLLVGQISEETMEALWAVAKASPGAEITVDLEARTATADGVSHDFQIDDYTRWRLLEGLDDIALTLRDEASITAFEAKRPSWMPTTQPVREGTQ
ncbi:3-isopropylmalate dehydratase small subunit [Agrococcus sp. KRD186]|jgi:3-isopropylmalate/(R)-2-methylmalate dehydratase small subunit|uniref:3-isopropylmalate dehydratase small subunit n=1 Tax=Agrococcus sp. KRD186 TaxID=2729730 RepID=UPI0019D1AD66|nr:3-isopropylmalate dehydratase small subunit [Agrococcus sp. KRD186]